MLMNSSSDRIEVNADLQAAYDSYYEDGTSEWRALGAKYKADNIINMTVGIPHNTVLDIGAGEGAVSAMLLQREFCPEVSCLEISDTGVKAIENRNLSRVVDVRKFDGYSIPYRNKTFDLAIASHVLEHVEHERVFLYEAKRVAKYVFIEVPLEDTFRMPKNYKANKEGHVNFYNFRTIRHLLQSSGFEVLDQRLLPHSLEVHKYSQGRLKGTMHWGVRAVCDKIHRGLTARMFTYHCGILCRSN